MASLKQRILCRIIGGHFWTKGQVLRGFQSYECSACGKQIFEKVKQ